MDESKNTSKVKPLTDEELQKVVGGRETEDNREKKLLEDKLDDVIIG